MARACKTVMRPGKYHIDLPCSNPPSAVEMSIDCRPMSRQQRHIQHYKAGEMVIYLSPKKYELFLRRIDERSPARFTLAKAKEIDVTTSRSDNKWVIVCDKSTAAVLRKAAREYCPEALPDIERAFRHDRFYWS
jgi:hypothetical protein